MPNLSDTESRPSPTPRARSRASRDPGPDRTHEAAEVLKALSEARLRCRDSLKPLRPVHSNLKHIIDRLEEGFSVDDCRQVVSVCETECQRNPASLEWLDAITPFRPDNFARKLGRAGAPAVAHKPDIQRETVGVRYIPSIEETAHMLAERKRIYEETIAEEERERQRLKGGVS